MAYDTVRLPFPAMGMASANSGWRLRARRSRNFGLRAGALSGAARRELLIHGTAGSATILGRKISSPSFARPFGGPGPQPRREPGHVFWVRVQIDGAIPYETRVRQRTREEDLEWMQPGDVVACRVDPGDRDRLVLYIPDPDEATRVSIAKILADGRRADATVLAAAPVAADYAGHDDPVLRLDLELRAWDETKPWRVRLVQPVPLAAIGLVDLGQHLEVAFFTVDHGESVAVDWAASLGEE
ncbi:hypothetical protein SAMN04244553_4741 [Nocardia amikacinitolerans]|uniref:Uncharacterized protein n=2 Tax=Nocardia amikacinitolerans TaxID=756689 RepID=A0A285LVW2_9NOCA|nr:hypothetical protein [Nocardia amikacinitolerans]MCP2279958.1 hypothetical protein [Nocardia amikacinitolerans]MCP2295774.1 hypothetical protein [Nocardia amikacinitolerans]SNY87786.1 hypothetical protein SAMN04244553_4741 [Nocardia amikacinitolerans]